MDRPRILSCSCPLALRMMMPIFWSVRRMVSQSEKPFMPGSITSRMAASQPGRCSRRGRAASALSASTASIPARRRFSAIISRMLASSSTTRTLTIYRSSVSIRFALCARPGMLRKIIFIQSAQTSPACQWGALHPGLRLPASASLSLASCWPRPQQFLPASATGGGRNCCPPWESWP